MSIPNDPGRDGARAGDTERIEPIAPAGSADPVGGTRSTDRAPHFETSDRFDTGAVRTGAVGTGAVGTSGSEAEPAHRGEIDEKEAKRARTAVRKDIAARERERFGGVQIGSAFFGWLAATGLGVILTGLVTAIAAGVAGASDVSGDLAADPATFGWAGAIALLAVLFVAYYCGGYVAGRMARFNGARQGVAVWAWAVVVAIVVAIVTALAGGTEILAAASSFPRIPLDAGDATVTAIVTALAAVVITLVGAVLGGLAGMRFHRRVDREGVAGLSV